MESPRWQIHSAQEHQIIHGFNRSAFIGEDPQEDTVVFQRTLKGKINLIRPSENEPLAFPVPVGSTLLFGGAQKGARTVFKNETYACQWIRLGGAGLRAHWAYLRERFGDIVSLDPTGPTVETITGIIEDFCSRRWIESHRIHNWINLFIDELSSKSQTSLSPAEVACERIRDNPFYPWSLKSLASEAGCSREHLSRIFLKKYTIPPATWLRRRRLRRVIRLLESTEIPISQISQLAGFGSLDSMGRLVQDVHGCTPTHIRDSRKTYTPTQEATFKI
jgi:AraC-like DNA-binding protein